MKTKLLALCILCTIVLKSNAQDYYKNNELKFNIGWFLADATAEFSFEHFLNDEASLGATIYYDAQSTDRLGKFGIGPNIRAYFSPVPRAGFFIEGFALYYTGDEEIIAEESNFNFTNNFSTFALGAGVGHKWTTFSEQFTVELNAGIGRNINPEEFQDDFILRAALAVGFRF